MTIPLTEIKRHPLKSPARFTPRKYTRVGVSRVFYEAVTRDAIDDRSSEFQMYQEGEKEK